MKINIELVRKEYKNTMMIYHDENNHSRKDTFENILQDIIGIDQSIPIWIQSGLLTNEIKDKLITVLKENNIDIDFERLFIDIDKKFINYTFDRTNSINKITDKYERNSKIFRDILIRRIAYIRSCSDDKIKNIDEYNKDIPNLTVNPTKKITESKKRKILNVIQKEYNKDDKLLSGLDVAYESFVNQNKLNISSYRFDDYINNNTNIKRIYKNNENIASSIMKILNTLYNINETDQKNLIKHITFSEKDNINDFLEGIVNRYIKVNNISSTNIEAKFRQRNLKEYYEYKLDFYENILVLIINKNIDPERILILEKFEEVTNLMNKLKDSDTAEKYIEFLLFIINYYHDAIAICRLIEKYSIEQYRNQYVRYLLSNHQNIPQTISKEEIVKYMIKNINQYKDDLDIENIYMLDQLYKSNQIRDVLKIYKKDEIVRKLK